MGHATFLFALVLRIEVATDDLLRIEGPRIAALAEWRLNAGRRPKLWQELAADAWRTLDDHDRDPSLAGDGAPRWSAGHVRRHGCRLDRAGRGPGSRGRDPRHGRGPGSTLSGATDITAAARSDALDLVGQTLGGRVNHGSAASRSMNDDEASRAVCPGPRRVAGWAARPSPRSFLRGALVSWEPTRWVDRVVPNSGLTVGDLRERRSPGGFPGGFSLDRHRLGRWTVRRRALTDAAVRCAPSCGQAPAWAGAAGPLVRSSPGEDLGRCRLAAPARCTHQVWKGLLPGAVGSCRTSLLVRPYTRMASTRWYTVRQCSVDMYKINPRGGAAVDDLRLTVAHNVRRARAAKGLSEVAAANAAGLSRAGYRNLEQGTGEARSAPWHGSPRRWASPPSPSPGRPAHPCPFPFPQTDAGQGPAAR